MSARIYVFPIRAEAGPQVWPVWAWPWWWWQFAAVSCFQPPKGVLYVLSDNAQARAVLAPPDP